jgi:hypothetical protein
MSAHDPLQYIGDILAWTHQSIVLEVELFQQLVKYNKNDKAKTPKAEKEESMKVAQLLPSLYHKCFENICEPLKVISVFHLLIRKFVIMKQ